jgi:hypothetical protein
MPIIPRISSFSVEDAWLRDEEILDKIPLYSLHGLRLHTRRTRVQYAAKDQDFLSTIPSISTKDTFLLPSRYITIMSMFKRIIRIAIVVELILLIGFIPTLFNPNARIYGGPGGGWDWSPWCFVGPMAGLMFVTGLAIDVAARKITHPVYRTITIAALVLALVFVWVRIVRSDQ